MSELQDRFTTAAEEAQHLPKRPDDATLLKLYAWYKQATVGDVQGARPGLANFVDRMKYDSWAKLKGTATDNAMQGYIDLVEKLKAGVRP